MTADLEKQFFETFGIEPDTSEVAYFTGNMGYPQITDRHYLELILIYSRISNLPICYNTVERLKEAILEDFIENSEDYKHQVQELFKGE